MTIFEFRQMCAKTHKKGAKSHIQPTGIMIIFAAKNDFTQMIYVSHCTDLHRIGCIASLAAVGVSTECLRTGWHTQAVARVFCVSLWFLCEAKKGKTLYEKYILCDKKENIHYICGI